MGAGLIMLREGFEASLVLCIVLAFLRRTGRSDAQMYVWAGALVAVAVSAAVGATLFMVGLELHGRAEAIWEASTMLAAAVLLTWMIFWMRRQAHSIKREIEGKVEQALSSGSLFGLALVAFVGVLREGVETALFLIGTVSSAGAVGDVIGSVVGLAVAAGLGYLVYRGSSRLNLARFFSWTSVLLLVFASYLVVMGVHELAEAGVIPENPILLAGLFAALSVPTLVMFVRRPATQRTRIR